LDLDTIFEEFVGACRTADDKIGNPRALIADSIYECKKFCNSYPNCMAIEYDNTNSNCKIYHQRDVITKGDASNAGNATCMLIDRHDVSYASKNNEVVIVPIGDEKRAAYKCTCADGETFAMVGHGKCNGEGENKDGQRGQWRDLQTVTCAAPKSIINKLEAENTQLTERNNLLVKKAIKLNRKLLDLAEASKPKNIFGMACDDNVKKSQNACFKKLQKCGENAILSWPIEWHAIHEHFDPKMHQHSNKSETNVGKPIRRRLLEHTAKTDLINLENLEYVQSSVTDTMYRFNCYGDDRNIGLCKLLDENVGTCNCTNRPIISFTYEGEEVFNNYKYSNAVITGRLECENGAYATHIDVDVIETGTTVVGRRRRLLNSKRGRSRLLAMKGGDTS
jgi:hypothetical protein